LVCDDRVSQISVGKKKIHGCIECDSYIVSSVMLVHTRRFKQNMNHEQQTINLKYGSVGRCVSETLVFVEEEACI
jgi:hypothetical protein